MKVRFSRQARADLRSIIEAILPHNPIAARRVASLLSRNALALSDLPERGAALQGRPGFRRLVVAPYLIVYRVAPTAIQVLRILHGARDIDLLLRELASSNEVDKS